MIGRSKPILLSAGALGALALVVVVPASAQEEEPFACPMPGDIAACQIQVPQPGMLHLVLHTHGKPGALLRVYGPDSVLLGEATAEGVQDPALDLLAPVAGVYLARDEGPGRAQDTPPIDLAVGFAGRAAADGSMQVTAESAADSASAPPAELPYYVSNGTAALLLVSLDPAPVTQLRHPLCEMIQAIGGSSNSCPPGRSLINANVSADFESGYTLVAIALLDRDDTPAVPAPDPDGGLGGEDSRTAIAYVSQPGMVHLATDTHPLYRGTAPRTTRLRVRLCELPHTIDASSSWERATPRSPQPRIRSRPGPELPGPTSRQAATEAPEPRRLHSCAPLSVRPSAVRPG